MFPIRPRKHRVATNIAYRLCRYGVHRLILEDKSHANILILKSNYDVIPIDNITNHQHQAHDAK